MNEHRDWSEAVAFWLKQSWVLLATWLGTITLTQLQAVVGIASGLAVLVYTILNTIKVRRELRRMK